MSVVEQGDGSPVAILNRNKPVFYAVPANVYESMMDAIEDIELAALVESRKNQDEVSTSVQQLINDL
jgi:antitoxin StbD